MVGVAVARTPVIRPDGPIVFDVQTGFVNKPETGI
jgi:hypothetical protein